MYLLDINVLLAIADQAHESHDLCWSWFKRVRGQGWATCPLVEIGFIRIISQPGYAASALRPSSAIQLLRNLTDRAEHTFLPDDGTFTNVTFAESVEVRGTKQVTDAYLIALSVKNGIRLATLDKSLIPIERHSLTSVIELIT